MEAMSYYELLGIPKTGTLGEIKQAYKQLARKYHRDVSPPGLVEEYTQKFFGCRRLTRRCRIRVGRLCMMRTWPRGFTLLSRREKVTRMTSGLISWDVREGKVALSMWEEGAFSIFSTAFERLLYGDVFDVPIRKDIVHRVVPYFLADLTEKTAQDDRLQILKASIAKLKEFISFCEEMELVPEEELETSSIEGPNSNVDRRAKKIARFKRQRAAESKLLEIKERKERRNRSTRAAASSTPVEAGEEDELDDDGEEEREAWFVTISLDIYKAFDLLEMLKKEEEMLTAIKEKQLQICAGRLLL